MAIHADIDRLFSSPSARGWFCNFLVPGDFFWGVFVSLLGTHEIVAEWWAVGIRQAQVSAAYVGVAGVEPKAGK